MASLVMTVLDTNPRWLGLTLASSLCALAATGVGILLNQLSQFSITPFTLLLHFVLAISLSAWVLNLRIKLPREQKPLFAIGIVVIIGAVWSSLQQWLGYLQTGLTNDITLVAGAMLMDATGGIVTYILFNLNVLRK